MGFYQRTPFYRCAILGSVLATMAPAAGGQGGAGRKELPPVSAEKAFVHMVHLAGAIGERTAGSPAEERTVEYLHNAFKSWGLEVRIQPFSIAIWHPKVARIWTEGDEALSVQANAVAFGGTTPVEGVVGELVDVGTASPRHLEGKDLTGKIVLVKRDVYIDYPDYWLTERLLPQKVAGMIFYSARGGGATTAYYNYKRSLKEKTPPSVVITYEEALALLKSRPRRVGIAVEADVTWGQSRNVIADIRGRSKPDEIVLLFAHHDSAITSPGAIDDAGGTAVLMELARAFSEIPPPARTIRFASWGGHEPGLMGSEAYLRANPEADRLAAVISFHSQGSTLGVDTWRALGPDEFIRFLKQVVEKSGLEAQGGLAPVGYEANSFTALEVPAMSIGRSLGPSTGHTPKDDLRWCSPVGLEGGLLLGAMVAGRLANDSALTFPHRLDPELLKRSRARAARWGWGVRPEANRPPHETRDQQ